jgi:DNA-binding transcriptional MerR regulator/methylmalonyl-CoA mutase cobalamin-binding subunit
MIKNAYRDPIYNLKAVVERTGVSADALRAWERRYGIPSPARTEASHRIYSQRDIDVIKWLVVRQEEGLRIGRAVKLWRSLEGEGQDPLRSMPFPSDSTRKRPVAGDTIAALREAWVSACLAFDEERAEQALMEALAMYPPEVVNSQVIGEGIAHIGQGWRQGDVTPQQEHFASQLAVRRLEALIAATPPPTRRGRILAACPPEEEHTLGLLTLVLRLRRAGWDVAYLGANVPLGQMEQTIEDTEPDLIVLSAQQLHTAVTLLEMAHLAQQQNVPLAFGGRIFNQDTKLHRRIPGHFLGTTLDQAAREVERLMVTGRRTPEVEPSTEAQRQDRQHYRDRRPLLEADVAQAMTSLGFDQQTLRELNQIVAHGIEAALTFSTTDLLGYQLDWLEELDASHRPSTEQIDRYLRAYRDAAERELDQCGATIVAWLRERVGQAGESE